MKKKLGSYKDKVIVTGDKNLIKSHEIHEESLNNNSGGGVTTTNEIKEYYYLVDSASLIEDLGIDSDEAAGQYYALLFLNTTAYIAKDGYDERYIGREFIGNVTTLYHLKRLVAIRLSDVNPIQFYELKSSVEDSLLYYCGGDLQNRHEAFKLIGSTGCYAMVSKYITPITKEEYYQENKYPITYIY